MDLPFDGAISRYFKEDAPKSVRKAIEQGGKNDILSKGYAYREEISKKDYEARMEALQPQLVRLQSDIKSTGKRVILVFEGRDAAGKGGTIKALTENLNPRGAQVVALSKPSDRESSQWYFQRYIDWFPAAGEMVIFDRSWYNRAIVEPVFGFCTQNQKEGFFRQLPEFEQMIVQEGITFLKFWLDVSQPEQLRRMLARESDPLKQWKLSPIDVEGLTKWQPYCEAIAETFERSHTGFAPWTVIRSDDKKRARIAAIQTVLNALEFKGKDRGAIGLPDPAICGGPEMWSDGADD
ncbi:polyphosphate kinase 2 [Gemmobacter caeni]|uniref:ADP/GDP-polyphosphate phosphotransferase n=1 Tax=Gemmobacter caeni TaxID=589035 RepID=A0A2T6BAR9_9RHOB|nr:polyphosphate kinase 2 [Gemmobacter caeni]PTX53157.1 polyphosphate kinase 2 [Gemmobacter caeni]TWJ05268.1 polyphosphate kinase 2 [Gemmobacter caeni]